MDGEAQFRRWLIGKIKRARWATFRSDDIDAIAVRLGVQPSVLEEAQAELNAERQRDGKLPAAIGTRQKLTKRRYLDLDMPKPVFEDWKRYCELRQVLSSTLLRSVVHTLLSGPDNPTWTGRGWLYRGHRLVLESYFDSARKRKGWPWNAKTDVTPGSIRALTARADACGAKYTALIRGAVIDLLEGRTKRLNIVTTASAMWEDENRYWTGREPEG